MWLQKKIVLSAKPRGYHLITSEIITRLPELQRFSVGMLQLFLQHTSASLSINENADPSVRVDFENSFNRLIPEDPTLYTHTLEGLDDMPAHLKSSLLGNSLLIPITQGKLNLGTWQGIYFCEHREHVGKRTIIATLFGD